MTMVRDRRTLRSRELLGVRCEAHQVAGAQADETCHKTARTCRRRPLKFNESEESCTPGKLFTAWLPLLVSRTGKHRQPRISFETRVSECKPAKIKHSVAVRADHAGMDAIPAQTGRLRVD